MNTYVKVHVLHCGNVQVDQSLPFKEKSWHPMPYTGWLRSVEKKIWLPVSCYLIEHNKGLILIDTGWHEDVRTKAKEHLGWFTYSMFRPHLPAGDSIREQLLKRKLKPEDLDMVILSHLHADHVSGIKHVQAASKILVSEPEWESANQDIGYVRSMWEGVNFTTFSFESIPFGPDQQGLDLYGDGLIYLISTPGHSKGLISILAKVQNGWLLLAADVGYASKSWENFILPGFLNNKKQGVGSLQWVKSFAKRNDCVAVLANHDPAIKLSCV